ncbi:TadE family protein [Streptomyces sp. SID3343]|uniref:TadE/TadG family type IV pilus assembly protein n=1 Tax=Streptomyces sp. SID3343 TaxID=2690260 RepID=UPI00136FE14E|nr:TadE family protein [Streptomyces sp. SID3343]MYW05841.1 pilus assembly protein [Streptomyces sp. SID3343]
MSISMAIVFPVFMLMLLAVIQGCLWWYAREAALHAAKEGVEAGRTTTDKGPYGPEEQARKLAASLGGGTLRDVSVTSEVTRTPPNGQQAQADAWIKVSVKGTSLSIVPGLPEITVVQHASGPMERWTVPNR